MEGGNRVQLTKQQSNLNLTDKQEGNQLKRIDIQQEFITHAWHIL